MKLYLMQHGEAATQAEDPERALTARGRGDVARLAAFVARAGIGAGRVLHSGKLRAAQTAQAVAAAMAPMVQCETSAIVNPNDDPGHLAAQLEGWEDDAVIVGHLPFLARLASLLVTGDAARAVAAFEPGTMLCLERDQDRSWRVAWMVPPALLR